MERFLVQVEEVNADGEPNGVRWVNLKTCNNYYIQEDSVWDNGDWKDVRRYALVCNYGDYVDHFYVTKRQAQKINMFLQSLSVIKFNVETNES